MRDHAKKRFTVHGASRTLTYGKWKRMIARCSRPAHQDYPYYGGRGVTVCERWKSFANFLADMGECPRGLTLERIDNDGNYAPGNCRWATRKDQGRNTRRKRLIEFAGIIAPTWEWAEILGIKSSTIRYRLDRAGWSIGRALTQEARPR